MNKLKILQICNIIWKAGEEILKIYSKKFKIYNKKDKSPVTIADFESEKIIINGLKKIFNNPFIYSEESNNKKKNKLIKNFWLIDPLDGTKEFIKKNGEFTINVAKIINNKVDFGIIYSPFFKKTYIGTKANAYEIINKKKFKKIIRKKNSYKTMIVSRSHSKKKEINKLINKHNVKKVLFLGSALKFCYLAEGKADIYPRTGTTYEWDTAAGHAIINGAGGSIRTESGEILNYGKKNFKNKGFIAKIN
tara:strand:- start:1098 stop:1844 length:747 start_codon:yes stop_codon:yes gene_type:complete